MRGSLELFQHRQEVDDQVNVVYAVIKMTDFTEFFKLSSILISEYTYRQVFLSVKRQQTPSSLQHRTSFLKRVVKHFLHCDDLC